MLSIFQQHLTLPPALLHRNTYLLVLGAAVLARPINTLRQQHHTAMATVPTVDLTSDDPAEEDAEADGRTDVAQLEHQLRLVDEELVDVCQLLQLLQRDITSSM